MPMTAKKLGMVTAFLVVAVAAGMLLVVGGRRGAGVVAVPCADRLIGIDLSSESRSPQLINETQQIVSAAAVSSSLCGTSFETIGVAGGGQVLQIVDSDGLTAFSPQGPNPQVRLSRLTGTEEREIQQLVTTSLARAWGTTKPSTTSVEALYSTAAAYSTNSTEVTIITAGVNDDPTLQMNRPLNPGSGKADAERLDITSLPARSVTLIGIAQIDSNSPPPSTIWPAEITSFNQTLCKRSTSGGCRIYPAASSIQALSPGTPR